MKDILIFDIKRFATTDGRGIRTAIYMKGCPLSCLWCHNPEGISKEIEYFDTERIFDGVRICRKKSIGKYYNYKELVQELIKDKVFFDQSGGGVTISGGEPLMQLDAVVELIKLLRKEGVNVAVDTSGFTSSANFERLLSESPPDEFLFDIKCLNSEKHKVFTAVDNSLIMANLHKAVASGIRVTIRIPVIKGYNFDDEFFMQLKDLLAEIKKDNCNEISLLPFHNTGDSKYARYGYRRRYKEMPSLTKESLKTYKQEIESLGWNVSIGG